MDAGLENNADENHKTTSTEGLRGQPDNVREVAFCYVIGLLPRS
jgi:hypothetical protein